MNESVLPSPLTAISTWTLGHLDLAPSPWELLPYRNTLSGVISLFDLLVVQGSAHDVFTINTCTVHKWKKVNCDECAPCVQCKGESTRTAQAQRVPVQCTRLHCTQANTSHGSLFSNECTAACVIVPPIVQFTSMLVTTNCTVKTPQTCKL